MAKYVFPTNIKILIPSTADKKYSFKKLQAAKEQLANVKNKLDEVFEDEAQALHWSQLHPFKKERQLIAKLTDDKYITNAWIKCYEILIDYDLLPGKTTEKFLHFDNASFPGSFILATHHLINTQRDWFADYQWLASSLLTFNEQNKDPLGDDFHLYKNYPNNWLMSATYNGDVLLKESQRYIYDKLHNKVSLYTSDLGFNVRLDYNNQESLHYLANVGQILSGLLCLKKGGSLVTKQYSIFEANTVILCYITQYFFDEFYISKPLASKQANSEIYLIGKGFKGATYDHPYVQALLNILEQANVEQPSQANLEQPEQLTCNTKIHKPVIDGKELPSEFVKLIIKISTELTAAQESAIKKNIELCQLSKFHNVEEQLMQWYDAHPIFPILTERKLRC